MLMSSRSEERQVIGRLNQPPPPLPLRDKAPACNPQLEKYSIIAGVRAARRWKQLSGNQSDCSPGSVEGARQAEKGIDSAELHPKRLLFIVCRENKSPRSRYQCAAFDLTRQPCDTRLQVLNSQAPNTGFHTVFIYSTYTDTQLDITMQVRKEKNK